MKHNVKFLSIVTTAFLMAGCTTLGPNYQRPDTQNLLSAGVLIQAHQTTDPVVQNWWQVFADEQLDALVETALKHNRSLQSLAYNLNAARSDLNLTTLDYLPTDQTTATAGTSRQSAAGLGAIAPRDANGEAPEFPNFDFNTINFAPRWELDLFGRIARQRQIAKAQYELQKVELQGLQLMVIADVVSQYFRLQSMYVEQAVVRQNLAIQHETVRVVSKQFEVGRVGEREVFDARSQLETTNASLPTLEASVAEAQYRLAVLTGLAPGQLDSARVGVSKASFLTEPLALGSVQDFIERSADVSQAEQRLKAANAQIGLTISELFPTLSLDGSIGYSSNDESAIFEDNALQFSRGATLSWSLTNLLRAKPRLRGAKSRKKAAEADYHQAVLEALSELNTALANHEARQKRQIWLESAAQNARRSAEISKIQYNSGSLPLLTLLTAEANQLERELQAQRGVYDIINDQVSVFRVLGAG